MDLVTFWCDADDFNRISPLKPKVRDIRAKAIYRQYKFSKDIHLRDDPPAATVSSSEPLSTERAYRPDSASIETAQV